MRRSDRLKSKPQFSYTDRDNVYDYVFYGAESVASNVPKCFQEIKSRPDRAEWEKAIKDELDSLRENQTWVLVDRPKDKNIIDCKWVFAIKPDEFGNPAKYKARVVARGFSQQYLVDYNETFAPMARISSFRLLLAFANQFRLLVHHMDVKTAFLNGKLKEEIYMKVLEGVKCNSDMACKLKRSLYGLEQSARCWFETFEKVLFEIDFKNSVEDRCVYILDKNDISKNIYVILYVDDLVIVTKDINVMNKFKDYLANKFKMSDLGEVKLFNF